MTTKKRKTMMMTMMTMMTKKIPGAFYHLKSGSWPWRNSSAVSREQTTIHPPQKNLPPKKGCRWEARWTSISKMSPSSPAGSNSAATPARPMSNRGTSARERSPPNVWTNCPGFWEGRGGWSSTSPWKGRRRRASSGPHHRQGCGTMCSRLEGGMTTCRWVWLRPWAQKIRRRSRAFLLGTRCGFVLQALMRGGDKLLWTW
mmetsp:Transcript_8805/g.19384  ORF Transcript_8805/g.19384 Transcript_8805/m.19384 type:complete len:201 (-) Transcript_8805:187-789(-)